MSIYDKLLERAKEAGLTATLDILSKLDLTEDEISVALWAAVAAMEAANLSITASYLKGHDVRPGQCLSAALAAALAGVSARDTILTTGKE